MTNSTIARLPGSGFIVASVSAAVIVIASCAPDTTPRTDIPVDEQAARTPAPAPPSPAPGAPPVARGEEVFEIFCSACHSLTPPERSAPAMSYIASYYRDRFDTEEAFVQRVVAFARAPSDDLAVLPESVRERWGEMAPMPLEEEQLRAVARYMWSL